MRRRRRGEDSGQDFHKMALLCKGPGAGLFVVLLFFTMNLHWSQGVKIQQKEKEILDNLLKNYDLRIRPTGINSTSDTAATIVTLNPYILGLYKVDEKHMDITIQMYFRQMWNDERLRFSDMGGSLKHLSVNDPSKIWTPDLFFPNEKKAVTHELMRPNTFLRIHPNGNILHSTRITLTFSCPMILTWFPFDYQICDLDIESYSTKFEELQLKWKEDAPAGVTADVYTPEFILMDFATVSQEVVLSTGKYSRLALRLLLKRTAGYYVSQLFIPSAMLVIVSWIVFWLDRGAITARLLIAIASLFTLANQASVIAANSVRISYAKSSDFWMGICLTFQFVALIETVVVHYWHRAEQKRGQKAVTAAPVDEEAVDAPVKATVTYQAAAEASSVRVQEGNGKQSTLRLKKRASDLKSRIANISTKSKRLDIISRICFPIGFALFVIVYWIINAAQYANAPDFK